MAVEQSKVYVRFVDGVDVFIPIDSHPVGHDAFRLLPNSEFDYQDETILFEFGSGDVVKTKQQFLGNGTTGILACELVSEGDKRNLSKRILFWILQNSPTPEEIIQRIGKENARIIFDEYDLGKIAYESIRNWFTLHRESIQNLIR